MIDGTSMADYLSRVFRASVDVRAIRRLGAEGLHGDPKDFGYGGPLEVECLVAGNPRRFVVSRARPTQGFGHDYPADRAWQALYGPEPSNSFPGQWTSLDVGFVRGSGGLVSAADATEYFQLVEKAEGQLYWLDLDRLLSQPLRPLDTDRARALASFLAEAHADKRDEPT